MYDPNAPFQPGKSMAPTSQVEITVSCKNLKNRDLVSKSDPMCVLFIKEFNSPSFVEVGRTEVIKNNLNPEFSHKFVVDYRFEESQKLKFEMYDVDNRSASLKQQDFLGRCECTLGEIVGASGSKLHKNLIGLPGATPGTIIVSADEVGSSKEVFVMQWKGDKLDKKDFLGKSDPFIQIYRIENDGSSTLVHRTEVCKNTLNPVWKPFRLSIKQMSNGNQDRPVRFDVYDWDDDGGQAHDLIGSFETSVAKLQAHGGGTRIFDLVNPQKKAKKKDYKNSGTLQLMQCTVETEYSFLDYIRGGTQINFTVAVDFTASNGNPNEPNSLHYIHPHAPNAYLVALKAVGEICQDYDSDKMFPALGFGAKLPPSGVVSHEFFLNFNPTNPYCHRIEGVMEAYKRALMSVQLYGPTNFSPVINHVARIASGSKDGSNYFVLLIITDGVISDMENTIASIVNASYLPMSIIIVGVGNADFAAMDFLDSDKGSLAFQGRRAQRDIVQFVPMRNYLQGPAGGNFELSQARLAKDVLAEVPGQFVSYMRCQQIKPKPPIQVANPQLVPSNVDTPAAPGGQPNQGFPSGQGGQPGFAPGGAPAGYPPPAGAQSGYPSGGQSGYPGGNQPPGYPSSGQPGYPQQGGQPGYPQSNQPGYPQSSQPGYPQAAQPGYPQQSGQPGYPQSNQPGYPPGGQPGYPSSQPGYPQSGQPGYPSGQPGYPSSGQPSYPAPTGQPGYPSSQPGYPPPAGQSGYPQNPPQPGYPQSGQSGSAYPQSGYPQPGQPPYQPPGQPGYQQPPGVVGSAPPASGQNYPAPQGQPPSGYPPQTLSHHGGMP